MYKLVPKFAVSNASQQTIKFHPVRAKSFNLYQNQVPVSSKSKFVYVGGRAQERHEAFELYSIALLRRCITW